MEKTTHLEKVESLINRHEIKYPTTSFAHVQKALSNFQMVPVYVPRIVHSIYFETNHFQLYLESNEGIVPRKKVRLRWYDDGDFYYHGAIEIKWSHPQHREKSMILYQSEKPISVVELKKKVGNSLLQPVLQVSYLRRYFANTDGIRATWDEKIHYQRVNSKFCLTGPQCSDESNVFEIKAAASFPKDVLLEKVPLQQTRFSKYCRGVEKTGLFQGY